MAHTHDHHHHHHHAAHAGINRAFVLAVGFNFIFVLIEAVYALTANSMSLLADAGHNLGDVLGLTLAGVANYMLTKPSTRRYSYGYKKTTMLAALANALLLALATGIISYESILRFLHPAPITEHIVMWVAAAGILVNGGTALLFIKSSHEDLNVKSAFLHLASDAFISLGVVMTGAAIWFTHWLWLDPLVGLLIAVTILMAAWGLMRDAINLILAGVPRQVNQEAVKLYLESLSGVQAVHDLHIWGLSTRETALTAHLVMPANSLSDQNIQEINRHLREVFHIHHATLQIEHGTLENPCGQAQVC